MMYYRQNPIDDIRSFFQRSSLLRRFIIINAGIFLIVNILSLVLWLFQIDNNPEGMSGISIITYYFSVPSSLEALILRPWTLVTYMFLHENLFHLLFNMIVLYFGGKIFLEFFPERKLLSTYIIGGIIGAAFYILAFNIFPVFKPSLDAAVALGASASVLAIFVAASAYAPNYSVLLLFFGRIKLKHLAWIVIIVDILSIRSGNAGGHIAHLGGAFWGFAYVYLLKGGKDFSINFGTMNFRKFFGQFIKTGKAGQYRSNFDNTRPMTDEEYNYQHKMDQKKIDAILEKISKSGYSSLTNDEKSFLFNTSKKQH
jgi:membrane associated rhomboid family serine protease